jgi:hypothetical protein
MRDEAVRTIEEILRRTVIAYLADIDTAANIALVAFVLAPQPDGDSRGAGEDTIA